MNFKKEPLYIPYKQYFDTVHDLWAGKFIGGTFGAEYEGFKKLLEVDVRDMLPLSLVENDDTDLQLLWLHALQEWGPDVSAKQLLDEWREHVEVPWGEYGVANANWQRGILPPESGVKDNWFYENGMGCPIRSEIWGMVSPGLPELAAKYAKQDAELDHGLESIQAEVFLSVVEASVFFEKDLMTLIEIGLHYVDPKSRFASLVKRTLEWCGEYDWKQVRRLILRHFGHPDFTNSLQNMGFLILALIAGEGDFIKTMNIAVNCGYDTDCTAASAGAILNAIQGSRQLPEQLRDSEISRYKISSWMAGFPSEGLLEDLTHSCCHVGLTIAERNGIIITDVPDVREESLILSVEKREVKAIAPPKRPFPSWIVGGPFFRDWEEVSAQHPKYPDHGIDLPSTRYMTHMYAGLESVEIDPEKVSLEGLRVDEMRELLYEVNQSTDSRFCLEEPYDGILPAAFFAYSEFTSPRECKNWMLIGSSGPIEVWFNGEMVLRSESYQPLNPTTFEAEVVFREGRNIILLKQLQSSQKLEAFVQFKHHLEKHWHQSFINTEIEWSDLKLEALS